MKYISSYPHECSLSQHRYDDTVKLTEIQPENSLKIISLILFYLFTYLFVNYRYKPQSMLGGFRSQRYIHNPKTQSLTSSSKRCLT